VKARRAALVILGLGLSAAAVWILLRQVSARDLVQNLRHASPGWLIAACLVTTLGYVVRAFRWGVILAPEVRVPFPRLFSATMIGFLAINTLPARIGELVRAYVLARTERIPTATVLGSVVIERVFDLALLTSFWALSLVFAPYPKWFQWSGYLTVGLGVVATGALWLLHAGHYRSDSWGARLKSAIPPRFLAPVERPIASFSAGLRAFGRPSALGRAGVASVVMWLVSGAVFLLVAKSMGMRIPLWSPFLLSYIVCVAIMVPSAPGFIGVLEGSCVVGLALLGVDASRALAYGVLYHVAQIVPVVLLGGYYSTRGHVSLGGGGTKKLTTVPG